MEQVLKGIRIVEVAQWWFVPSAGAVLADWGADVIKIEHPVTGDPQRGLVTSGFFPPTGGVNFMMEQSNRGKRSVGIDLANPAGRDTLMRLVETADVFLNNFLAPDIVMTRLTAQEMPSFDRTESPNPIVNSYRTKDGRWLFLNMLQPDRFWPDLCRHIGREDLITDERYASGMARFMNRKECVQELAQTFAARTLAEWRETLAAVEGVWAPMQSAREVGSDPQAIANGYLPEVDRGDGTAFTLVASPVQFDETPTTLRPAPEAGQHTEEVLLSLGLTWEQIAELKTSGAIS